MLHNQTQIGFRPTLDPMAQVDVKAMYTGRRDQLSGFHFDHGCSPRLGPISCPAQISLVFGAPPDGGS